MNLLSNIKIWKPAGLSTHAASATTHIDMMNWDGCLFILINGTTYVTSTGTLIVQQSSAASTGLGIWGSTFSNKVQFGSTNRMMAVDVVRPLRRYLRLKALTCTGVSIIPITYKGRLTGTTGHMLPIRATSNQPSGVHICTS